MLKFGNIILTNNSNWLNIPEHNVITSGNHGTVTASPNKGIQGTEVTLSNSPESGYEFSSYSVTGATLKNDNQFNIGESDVYVEGNFIANLNPLNPLNLPEKTIRVKFSRGYTPTMGTTKTLVDAEQNIWDIYWASNAWNQLFYQNSNLLEVLGANTTGVTDMKKMFQSSTSLTTVALFDTSSVTTIGDMFNGCTSLTSVPLFDTSSVTNMQSMFNSCTSLAVIPLFNTSNVTNMNYTFMGCRNVQSGALALYQQASSQTNPPSHHDLTFYNCGIATTTGSAELAQIPSGWKS